MNTHKAAEQMTILGNEETEPVTRFRHIATAHERHS